MILRTLSHVINMKRFHIVLVFFYFRWFYWFVMSEAIGPIAINIVRVFKDVATTLITYGLFLVGFTLGFFMLLYYYIQSKHDLSTEIPDNTERRAKGLQLIAPKVILQLIFATFNPEEIDWQGINVINDTKVEIVMNELLKNQNFHFDLQIHSTLLNNTYLHCQMTGFISIRVQNF